MTLGEKIQKLRKACGLSQMQLAEQLNVSRQSISKWELNESVPDINKIIKLSEVFSVSVDELVRENPAVSDGQADTPSTIEEIVKRNHADNLTKIGIITTVLGIVLLILECLFLPVLAAIQKAQVNGQGFYTDFMEYAFVQPMPIIFILTAVVVGGGIVLIVKGYREKKKLLKK